VTFSAGGEPGSEELAAHLGDTLVRLMPAAIRVELGIVIEAWLWPVGHPDYLVRVGAPDLAAYQLLPDEKLATLPGVQRLTSTIVMKRVVGDRAVPIVPGAAGR